jgi:hypothetical protein
MTTGEVIRQIILARPVTHVYKNGKWVSVDETNSNN